VPQGEGGIVVIVDLGVAMQLAVHGPAGRPVVLVHDDLALRGHTAREDHRTAGDGACIAEVRPPTVMDELRRRGCNGHRPHQCDDGDQKSGGGALSDCHSLIVVPGVRTRIRAGPQARRGNCPNTVSGGLP
jgi:hypothetical protein